MHLSVLYKVMGLDNKPTPYLFKNWIFNHNMGYKLWLLVYIVDEDILHEG